MKTQGMMYRLHERYWNNEPDWCQAKFNDAECSLHCMKKTEIIDKTHH